MSTADPIPLAEAQADAAELERLCAGTAERWAVAGSVRRLCPVVHDVEHVVVPAFGELAADAPGLFGATRRASLLWARVDALVADGTLAAAVYPDGRRRWGEKMRGVVFRGRRHELFTADPLGWGLQLAIRTGPWEFSRGLVARLRRCGFEARDGLVWPSGRGYPRPVAEERELFLLAQVPWISPADRRAESIERMEGMP